MPQIDRELLPHI